MRVELLAEGTELLLGDIVNTNAAWLGQRLAEAGVDVTPSVGVRDKIGPVAEGVARAPGPARRLGGTRGRVPNPGGPSREGFCFAAGVW